MSDDAAPPRSAEGFRPATARLVSGAFALAKTRLELLGVELAIERHRLQSLIVLSIAGAILATFALVTLSVLVVAYFWDTDRYLAILGLGAIYAVLAALAFLRARGLVHDGPAPFASTVAEFEKDRARIAGETPASP